MKKKTIWIIVIVIVVILLIIFGYKYSKKLKRKKLIGTNTSTQVTIDDEVQLDAWGFPENPSIGDIWWTDEDGDGHNEKKWTYMKNEEGISVWHWSSKNS